MGLGDLKVVRFGLLGGLVGCSFGGHPGEDHSSSSTEPAPVEAVVASSAPQDAWLDVVQLRIAAGSLRFNAEQGGFVAHNVGQGLKALIDERGARLTRPAADLTRPDHGARLRFSAWGREGALAEVGSASPELGGCTRLEQTWLVEKRPAGANALELVVDVEGATVEAGVSDLDLELVLPNGDRYAYAELLALDADGRQLEASMRASDGKIHITVSDANARYPLLIDPLAYHLGGPWQTAGTQADALYGAAVAGAGDVNGDGYDDLLVAAPYLSSRGRVYAYYGRSGGPPTTASWSKTSPVGTSFGASISGAGDINADGYSDIIVGQPYATGGGKVFIYFGASGGLVTKEASPVVLASPLDPALFGFSVAGVGDVNGDHRSDVLVGAPWAGSPELKEGFAYLYLADANGSLSTSPAWTRQANVKGAFFGHSVAALGDVNGDGLGDAIVGAPGYTGGGRVWVYVGHQGGTLGNVVWSDPGGEFGQYGYATSSAGDLNGDGYADIVIGAPQTALGDQLNVGSVWLIRNTASGINTSHSAEMGEFADQRLGSSLAALGDVNGDGYADYGQGWPQTNAALQARNVMYGGASGPAEEGGRIDETDAVAGAGDVNGDGFADVLGGSPRVDDVGAARVHYGTGASQVLDEDFTLSPATSKYGGTTLLSDLNGDGFADLLVAAPAFDDGQQGAGKVFQHLSDGTRLGAATAWAPPTGGQVNAQLGAAFASGDFNGDGILDAAIGAPGYDNPDANEGRVSVYLGSATGLQSQVWKSLEGGQAGALFGTSLAAGDVNGDGIADLAVGAPGYDNGQTDEGRVAIFHGASGGLGSNGSPNRNVESNKASAAFGTAIALGDITGDGLADLAVGAPTFTNDVTNEGCAYAFYATGAGIPADSSWSREGDIAGTWFGGSLSVGDYTGDGRADLVVGARQYSNGSSEEGRVFLYVSGVAGLGNASYFRESNQTNGHYGEVLSSADMNNDGFADLVVGYQGLTNQNFDGAIDLFYGVPTGLVGNYAIARGAKGSPLGKSLALGDINGDGLGDWAAGVTLSSKGGVRIGRFESIAARARQLKPGLLAVIPPGGKTVGTGFDVDVFARSPFGRTRVKLAVEVKLLGKPFDGTNLVKTTSWKDTGVDGVHITQSIVGLTANKAYHWRARVLYEPVYGFGPTHSRWYYGGNAAEPQGVHVRTP
jgi:hypothetical protein